jgi:phenylpyruvate tautomerase PptA (4-oxalocrotonate tautomerase family)
MFAGRSKETKLRLYRDIADCFAKFGVPSEHVHVILIETPLENWSIRGAQAASDVELGFRVHL